MRRSVRFWDARDTLCHSCYIPGGKKKFQNPRNEITEAIVIYLNPRYDSGRTHPYHPIMRPLIFSLR